MLLNLVSAKLSNYNLIIIEVSDPQVTERDASQNLIKNMEDLVRVNKELKDRNEELEFNMLSNPFKNW